MPYKNSDFYKDIKASQEETLAKLAGNGGTSAPVGDEQVVAALKDFGKSVGGKIDALGESLAPNTANAGSSDWLKEYQKALNEYSMLYNDAITRADNAKKRAEERANSDYTRAKSMLSSNYGNTKEELARQRSIAEQTANINYNKLLKYLPEQLKAQGLYGVGKSSGTYLRAANDHGNRISDILSKYASGMGEAENAYNQNLTSLMASKNASLDNADSIYSQAIANADNLYASQTSGAQNMLFNYLQNKETAELNQKLLDDRRLKEAQDEWFEHFKTLLNTGTFTSEDELNGIIAQATGKVNEDQLGQLQSIVDTATRDINAVNAYNDTAKLLTAFERVTVDKNVGKNKGFVNDTIKVNIGDTTVKITTGNEVSDKAVLEAVDTLNIENGTVFIYNGALYYKAPNGKVVTVDSGKLRELIEK